MQDGRPWKHCSSCHTCVKTCRYWFSSPELSCSASSSSASLPFQPGDTVAPAAAAPCQTTPVGETTSGGVGWPREGRAASAVAAWNTNGGRVHTGAVPGERVAPSCEGPGPFKQGSSVPSVFLQAPVRHQDIRQTRPPAALPESQSKEEVTPWPSWKGSQGVLRIKPSHRSADLSSFIGGVTTPGHRGAGEFQASLWSLHQSGVASLSDDDDASYLCILSW